VTKKLADAAKEARIGTVVAIEESSNDVTEEFVLVEVTCQGLSHFASANDQHIATMLPVDDSLFIHLPFPEAPGGKRQSGKNTGATNH
jgi:hypothetical protein